MSDVRILDYVKNVEMNRQRLLQNCWNKGKPVSANASLNNIVSINNTIEASLETSTARTVRYFDIDSTILLEHVLQPNEILPAAPATPVFDSSFLIFDKWKASAGLTITDSGTIAEHNVDIGAQYKVKEQIEIDGVLIRPTTFKCCFNSVTGLSPTLNYRKTGSATLYIDWGDGTINTITSTATTGAQAHTYSSPGNYIIRLYSTANYGFNTSSSKYLLNSQIYNQALMYAYIGDNLTSIEAYAFANCSTLTSIVIPDGVTYIGNNAFANCTALTSIVIPDSVTVMGTYTFSNCYSLSSIVLPNALTTIGGNAFYYCTALTSIVLPDSVTTIGGYAFQYCYALTSIVIPDGVTAMSSNTFQYCSALTSIVIPDSITAIGNSMFANCTALTSIVLPDGVTTIASNAFANCVSLSSIVIPDSVTSIGTSAFTNCHSLSSIVLPNAPISISDSTFAYCYSLTSIVIPNSVTTIAGTAFQRCYALTSIVLPDNLISIGANVFQYCSALTSIVIPDSITSIVSNAFTYCYALSSIVLPDNFNISIQLTNCKKLTSECYVHIANQLADLTGASAKTITFGKDQNAKLYGTYLHSVTGELCEESDENAINVITFIQNKNWTVSLA